MIFTHFYIGYYYELFIITYYYVIFHVIITSLLRRRFPAALIPQLFGNSIPDYTTRAPLVGFDLATECIQFYVWQCVPLKGPPPPEHIGAVSYFNQCSNSSPLLCHLLSKWQGAFLGCLALPTGPKLSIVGSAQLGQWARHPFK